MGCVYRARNKKSGRSYIGKTTKTLSARKHDHQRSAEKGRKTIFYNAIRSYGWNNFSWKVLACSNSPDELNRLEKEFIKKFNSSGLDGYNMTDGGDGGATITGRHRSKKTRKKISQSRKGIEFSDETKEKLRQASLGKKASETTKKKMSQSQRKRHNQNGGHSTETKSKIGKANKGKKRSKKLRKHLSEVCSGWTHTDEAKEKIRKAGIGRKHTDESKEKIRQANFGKKLSDEHRAKISKALKGVPNTKLKGKKLSEEHKRKLSESHKGYKPSAETRRKLSASLRLAYKEGRR